MFGNDRDGMRQFFCDCWKKEKAGVALEPLETQIVAVIKEHPEYHTVLENVEQAKAREYFPELNETNPFLHMSMHLSIREQMGMDRPVGVRSLMQSLIQHFGEHEAEHEMMDCLAEVLWQAQKQGAEPDDQHYLQCLNEKKIR
ncbi:MAG TPA: DUF1841 family protein [Thiothrix sp.]|nr:DUF1841 family protein [Thiothrix sp.]